MMPAAWTSLAIRMQGDMPPGSSADDFSILPEFWLFVAAGVMTLGLAVGIAIFWWRIGKDHDRETR
ncbi:MAG: hypothetical protein RLZZ246_524 [Planctomycetota bacterium]|jgi:hypothetical protein